MKKRATEFFHAWYSPLPFKSEKKFTLKVFNTTLLQRLFEEL